MLPARMAEPYSPTRHYCSYFLLPTSYFLLYAFTDGASTTDASVVSTRKVMVSCR